MDINKYFNKNINSVSEEDKIINNIDKNACANYAINNSYDGFKYYGDKNKCMIFKSDNFNNPINTSINNYNIKSFVKINDIIDLKNIYDQTDSYNFVKEIIDNKNIPDGLIKEIDINNENDCIDYCVKEIDNCKSVVYMDQPKSCSFYKKKNFKNKFDKNNNSKLYDVYTIKNINSYNNDTDIIPISSINVKSIKKETNDQINITNIPLYNCSGLSSTNPFCTSEYNPDKASFKTNFINYTNCISDTDYNKECKKKYGNEYKFDNDIYNLNSIIDCENGGKKVKCKLDFTDFIETFQNYENEYENKNKNKILSMILLLILIIILYIFIYCI